MRVHHGLIWLVLTLLLAWGLPPATEAQLYRYEDANGNWCYTDNLADVPLDQREDCKQYESIQAPTVQPDTKARSSQVDGQANSPEESGRLRDELKARKVALDKEYEALVRESDDLEKMSANIKTEQAKKEFEDRKQKFNQRVKTFEEQRQAFESDLQVYNDIIGSKK